MKFAAADAAVRIPPDEDLQSYRRRLSLSRRPYPREINRIETKKRE